MYSFIYFLLLILSTTIIMAISCLSNIGENGWFGTRIECAAWILLLEIPVTHPRASNVG